MIENLKDIPTTVSGAVAISAVIGLMIFESFRPEFKTQCDTAISLIATAAGLHLMIGAKS